MVLESNTLEFLFLNDGKDGVGIPGENGKTLYTWIKYSQNSDGSDMTDDSTDAIYIGLAYNKESSTESENPSDYNWTKIKGNDGEQGDNGYTIILSNENISFSTDNNRKPLSNQTFICEVNVFQGTTAISDFTIGNLTNINGLSSSVSNHVITLSTTTSDIFNSDSGSISVPIIINGVSFTKTITFSLSKQGEQGSNGISVSSVVVQYYQSTSATELIGGSWSTDRPIWVDGKYIWSKQITTLSNGSSSETNPVCITGGTGSMGATGRGIESITTEYYLSTSKTTQVGGEWSETQPQWSSGHYVWTRSKIVYNNPSSIEHTTPICDTTWEAMQSQIDTVKESIQSVELKVDQNTKTISQKASQTDIEEAINNYDGSTVKTLRDTVAQQTVSIGEIKSEVSDVKTTVESKADGSTVMELQETVSKNKQDADGFKTEVAQKYATKNSLNNYAEMSQVQTAIEQKADAILGTVTDSEGNTTTYQGTLAGLATQVEDAEGNITQLQQTSQEISLKAGNAEKLALESKVLSVNLSVENMNVATDTDGNNGSYSNCKTTVSVFYGIENVTSNATITCTPSTGVTGSWNATSKVYTISNMTVDNGTVLIKATYKVTINGTEQTLTNTKTFSLSKSKQGIVGDKGDKGNQGISVKSVTPEYYLSTSSTSVTGGSWVTIPPIKTSTTYIWKREYTVYDNNTESYSSAVLDQSLNELFNVTAELKVGQNNITAEINDAKGSYTSLKASLDGIQSTVTQGYTDAIQEAESNFTQRADSIEERVETNEGILASHNTSIGEISDTVQDNKGNISKIQQFLDGVQTEIVNARGDKTTLSAKIGEISQNVSNVEGKYSSLSSTLNGVSINVGSLQEQIKQSFDFTDDGLIIKSSGTGNSNISLKLGSNRISFLDGTNEVAYISNNKLHITSASIVDSLQIGGFAFMPMSNGSLSFNKI